MASSLDSLEGEIETQNALFNELRLSGSDPAGLEEVKKKLGELKKSLGQAKAKAAADGATASGSKEVAGKKKERILLKTAKGTRDYGPAEMFCREYVERIVKDCFSTYGGSCLDTPVFERKEILAGKYGEDAKLIFDLMDQGGEQLSLRYDHTVPLARYLAMMGGTNTQSKLWQVGKVYRRDNPVMSKGRMREFSQADFDISGTWDPMIPDAEIISLICTILSKIDVGEFTIKMVFSRYAVYPQTRLGLFLLLLTNSTNFPDKIGEYVKHKGGPELLAKLLADSALSANPSAKQGLDDMGLLFTYLSAYNVIDKISFDMSLARGLDYYTGIIYEAIVDASAPPGFKANPSVGSSTTPSPALPKKKVTKKVKNEDGEEEEEVDESQVGVGSIAAGGRYDGLVGMFSAAAAGDSKKSATSKGSIPCIGISIGLDRIFALVWPKWVEKGKRSKETMVYVMAAGDGLLVERMKLVKELRDANIKVDFLAKKKPKLPVQFAAGERDEVPFAIILGESEIKEGYVMVKQQKWEMVDGKKVKVLAEGDEKGEKVDREQLVEWLRATQTWKDWEDGKL
ncbi:histidyl-tRNA synthetase [Lentinula edodes]|uniref:histidine--tRNA ligase n=1 Tax=Lentinula edodes TaxID=5353 RepID=A0A1Q3EP26_LENED|nr:histidyl-tRNA synthetase [Lentinula edodes]